MKRTDLTGRVFGVLQVIRYSHNDPKTHAPIWLCRCQCGTEKLIPSYALLHGYYKSCGCLQPIKRDIGVKQHIAKDRIDGTRVSALKAKLHKGNKSGHKGVSWMESRKKWRAYIGFQGRNITLGYFDKKEDAIKARELAEEKYHKPYLEKDGTPTE